MMESFNNLESREKKLLILLGLIIISYLLYTFVYGPVIENLNQVKADIETLESKETTLTRDLSNFNVLRNDYGEYNLNDLLVILPDQGKVPEVILWVEEIFSDPSLSRPNINFSLDTSKNNQKYLELTFAFSGPYENIYSLMENIENSTRLTTIESMNLSGSQNSLTANLVVRVYGQNFGEIAEGEFNFENIRLFGGR